MNDPDDRLVAALQADAPPVRDALFRLDVLFRLERARLRRRMTLALAVAAAVVVAAAVRAPAIDAWLAADVRWLPLVALGLAAASLALPGVTIDMFPGARRVLSTIGRWFDFA
jgi:hypothetical protein